MKIIFCKEAEKVSDYEIEDFFQSHKNIGDEEEVKISSFLLLYRFRVAVKQKEIKPFDFEVIDFDGTLYVGDCDKEGRLDDQTLRSIFQAKVMNQEEDYLMALIDM